MKRLSVRLSVVGAVIALGAAVIAHSILSKSDDPPPEADEQGQQVAQAENAEQPSPIRDDEQQPVKPLSAPPASAFSTQDNELRTVSHEDVPSSDDASRLSISDAQPIATEDVPSAPTYGTASYDAPGTGGSGGDYRAAPADASAAGESERGDESATDVTSVAESSASTVPVPPDYATDSSTTAPRPGGDFDPSARSAGGLGAPTVPTADPYTASETGATTANVSRNYTDPSAASQLPPADDTVPTAVQSGNPSAGDSYAADPVEPVGVPSAGSAHNPAMATALPESESGLTGYSPQSRTTAGAGAGVAALGATNSPGSYPATDYRPPSAADATPSSTTPSYPPTGGSYPTSPSPPANDPGTTPPGFTRGVGPAPSGATGYGPSSYGTASRPAAAGMNSSSALPVGNGTVGPVTEHPVAGQQMNMVSDVPGERQLEGQQTPAIVLEKTAPEEIQVDRKATFQITVRNTGNAPAHNVVVVDSVPRGTEFIDAVPPCTQSPSGTVSWNLSTIRPGEQVTLSLNLMPKVAGEIGSVAQATFQAQAAVRTICTKPELALELNAPETVLIGQQATLDITVTNTGSGAASGVVLEEDVPDGFAHAAGRQLEHEIGILRPQESRRLTLVLDSTQPGIFENHLIVRGDGNLFDEDIRKVQVTTPRLEVSMQGPALRYLDRQATYAVRLSNPGTASARNVELVTYLPKGMKYVTSDNHGQYDTQTHAVYWSLEELPADKQGEVHVTVLPIEPGSQKLKADGHAELGLKHTCEHEVVVEGLAELLFTVTDVADPIEVGSDTSYEIRVHNRGSKADTDIQLLVEFPAGITPTGGEGPSQAMVRGPQVLFGPLARLAPDEQAVYKVRARGDSMGDHVIRVQLKSAELRVPVTKEESTRVYTDR